MNARGRGMDKDKEFAPLQHSALKRNASPTVAEYDLPWPRGAAETSHQSSLQRALRLWVWMKTRQIHLLGVILIIVASFFVLLIGTQRINGRRLKDSSTLPFELPPLGGEIDAHPLERYEDIHRVKSSLSSLFEQLYDVKEEIGELEIPATFRDKVANMFSAFPDKSQGLSFIEKQNLTLVRNLWTYEETLYNPVRRYRPGYSVGLPEDKEQELRELIKTTSQSCDFCKGETMTARNTIGPKRNKYAYIASNVAKYNKHHGLVMPFDHSPLDFNFTVIEAMLKLTSDWCRAVQAKDETARFPHIMWDTLSRASASQVHLHWQVSVSKDHPYTRGQEMRDAASRYSAAHYGANFWADVAAVHEELGLAVRFGDAIAFAYLTPNKEKEIIVLGKRGASRSFARAFYASLRALIDVQKVRAFSVGVLFEEVGAPWPLTYPAIARIVDRGNPYDLRNDVGAMEFYGAYNVASDPVEVAAALRKASKIVADANDDASEQFMPSQ